jgi:hypothetical protein
MAKFCSFKNCCLAGLLMVETISALSTASLEEISPEGSMD